MLRLATDEDLNGAIVAALRRHSPPLDLLRAQDVLGLGAVDLDILAWAAREERVVISSDRESMIEFANERVRSGLPMSGLISTTTRQSVADAVADILLLAEKYSQEEMGGRVIYLPNRS